VIAGALALLMAVPAFGYDEKGEPSSFTIFDAAEIFGYSTITIPADVAMCRFSDPQHAKCITVPPGSILLIPFQPSTADSLPKDNYEGE
jgi:hypothetical protein